jgi:proline racemase
MIHRLRTIDAHTAGQPIRLILAGFPPVQGGTMLDRRDAVRSDADGLRRALLFEPRGHLDVQAALLLAAVSPAAQAGLLFMDAAGYPALSGDAVIAAATAAIERGVAGTLPHPDAVVFDTPAGPIRATADVARDGELLRAESVSFVNVPSFVLVPALPVRLARRSVAVDVAFGGAFYAIVDSEAVGLPIEPGRLHELRQIGMQIREAAAAACDARHPSVAELAGIEGTVFVGPPRDTAADLRNVVVREGGAISRSPSATATCAVMAVLDAMSLLPADRPFVQESVIGTRIRGWVGDHLAIGEYQAIVPEIEGAAWITGEHVFEMDDRDPLREGYEL